MRAAAGCVRRPAKGLAGFADKADHTPHAEAADHLGQVRGVLSQAKRITIDSSGMNSKSNDPSRVLIHHHQHSIGPQRHGFASKEVETP
jgi:hypothetical protein